MSWLAAILKAVLDSALGAFVGWLDQRQRDAQARKDAATEAELDNARKAQADAQTRRTVEQSSRDLSDRDLVGRM